MRIVADAGRLESAAVGQRDLDVGGPMDDVAVGQDESVVRQDEPGPAAALSLEGFDLDRDDRRADRVGDRRHRPGIGVEDGAVIRHELQLGGVHGVPRVVPS
jgi:hypothetical protein